MIILFTTNDKFWSRVLKFLAREPCSHVAFVFCISGEFIAIDCSTTGGRMMPIGKFLKNNHPYSSVSLMSDEAYIDVLFRQSLKLVGVKYDKPAYAYGVWRGILNRLFACPIPDRNLFARAADYVCTEIFYPIKKILARDYGIDFGDTDLSLKTPYWILKQLESHAVTDQYGHLIINKISD